jgi:hypothetical protein
VREIHPVAGTDLEHAPGQPTQQLTSALADIALHHPAEALVEPRKNGMSNIAHQCCERMPVGMFQGANGTALLQSCRGGQGAGVRSSDGGRPNFSNTAPSNVTISITAPSAIVTTSSAMGR